MVPALRVILGRLGEQRGNARAMTLGGLVVMAVLVAAIETSGGPGGGGDPTPTPTSTPTPTATPEAGTANLWVAEPGDTCDSTPTREATAVGRGDVPAGALACTIAQATSAASSGDTIGVSEGEHGSNTSYVTRWGASGKTLTYVGEDGAVVDTGPTKANYNGFNFLDNATVDNIDAAGDYPIVGMWSSNITWRNSTLRETETIRDCGSDEPIMIEDGAASSYTITNVTLENVVVEQIKAMQRNQGSCPSNDNFHLELIRVGKGVDGLLIDRVDFKACPDGSGYDGCGSGAIFITTAPANTFSPKNITIRNSIFRGTPNTAIQVQGNVGSCVGWTIAYSTFHNSTFGISGCSSGNSVLVVGNAGPGGSSCTTGFTWTKNVWQDASCGTDTEAANLGLDADKIPQPGSAVIDAAETPGASDYCTGDLGSIDFAGTSRPFGATGNCDAGAYEVG